MTVTFVDTPGSTLPSRQEAIDFEATGEVTDVRVCYDGEQVYDGSVFKAPYLSSTKDGGTFSIVRTSGWKKPFTIHVTELSPTDAAWTAIYDADLSTVANTDMTASGSYLLAGATWWAKGAIWTLSGGVADAVNGSGLRLVVGATVNTSDRPLWRLTTSFTNRRVLFLPFAQFSEWNSGLPTWVAWRITGSMSGSQERYPVAGVAGFASDSAGITNAERGQAASIEVYGPDLPVSPGRSQFLAVGGSTTQNANFIGDGSTTYDAFQFGLLRGMQGAYMPGVSVWGGSLVSPGTSAQNVTGVQTGLKAQELANPGFFFTCHKPFSDGQVLTAILNRLAVFQPRAA